MFSLTVLILIQSLFCLFFFLYFRHKISQQLKLKEYKQEIDEVVTIFNRQAERHIAYLERLLDNDIFKSQPSLYPSPKTPPPNLEKAERAEEIEETLSVEPKKRGETKKVSDSLPQQSVIPQSKSEPSPTLPPSVAHAFYARFSEPEKVALTPTSKKSSSHESVEISNIKNQLQFEILRLHDEGRNIHQIAQHLSVSTAEVKLILKLKGRI